MRFFSGVILEFIDFLTKFALHLCWHCAKIHHQLGDTPFLLRYFYTQFLNLLKIGGYSSVDFFLYGVYLFKT